MFGIDLDGLPPGRSWRWLRVRIQALITTKGTTVNRVLVKHPVPPGGQPTQPQQQQQSRGWS